jgi:hypothetical protein
VGDRLFDDIYGAGNAGCTVLLPHNLIPDDQRGSLDGEPVITRLTDLLALVDRPGEATRGRPGDSGHPNGRWANVCATASGGLRRRHTFSVVTRSPECR